MPKQNYRLSIHWFRRDLRLSDNISLSEAVASSQSILPIYVLSDWRKKHSWTGAGRQHHLCECLESLSLNLNAVGSRLLIRRGPQFEEIEKLLLETKADALFCNQDPDPFGKSLELQLESLCRELGVAFHSFADIPLQEAEHTTKADGSPYRVYTPYSRNWLKLPVPASRSRPKSIKTPSEFFSEALPTLESWQLALSDKFEIIKGGEKSAQKRLQDALKNRVPHYHAARDIPSLESTSRLSQDLRWGTISIRKVFHAARKAEQELSSPLEKESVHTFIKELAWRDFYFHLLHAFPQVLESEFNSDYRNIPWEEPSESFEAWKNGLTGFPIVDAGMRQLANTGFMHNRVRMIVAMFLTKDLHLDWRLGEQHFAQHLLDGEIASNNGGWQWSAGTGADAAPYFRIQNPWTQSKRFDPQGEYIQRWVPELAKVEPKAFHLPPSEGARLVKGYPAPILDHSVERNKTLAVFKTHLEQVRGTH